MSTSATRARSFTRSRPVRALAVSVGLTAALTACGGTAGSETAGGTSSAGSAEKVQVAAGFFPLAHAVEKVGGDRVEVTNLTGEGQDPHHVELTPRQVAQVGEADLVVWEKGMMPAADSAVASANPQATLDLAPLATIPAGQTETVGDGHDHETVGDGHDHEGEGDGHDHEGEGDGHDHGLNDPHFWLDPEVYGQAVQQISAKLAEVDPEGAATYQANAKAFQDELAALDGSFEKGLSACKHKDVVTGHTAFAYLTKAYGLNQVGVAGVLNEGEPDPGRLAAVTDFVKASGVDTVYGQVGAPNDSIEAVAAEAGTKTAELDDVALTRDAGYVERMQKNLQSLASGQNCA